MITYHSTRGSNKSLAFKDIILSGVADDGGLYLPQSITLENLKYLTQEDLSYEDFVKTVFIALDRDASSYVEDLDLYPGFTSPEPTLKEITKDKYVMELFHGPTKSFKDYALQPLGAIADKRLEELGERGLVVVATSGDTGSAAIEAVKRSDNIDIVVLHPFEKISDYQRRQMTEVIEDNVLNIAIKGSYDDCQKIAKSLLQKVTFNKRVVSLNSINWLRVMGQTSYYVWLAQQFSSPVNVAIPSGNFGNAYSAWFGRSNGLSINEIFCASNSNDVLTKFISTGLLEPKETIKTIAPSMDIQIPSSLERLIYDLGGSTKSFYEELQKDGKVSLETALFERLSSVFTSLSFSDKDILEELHSFYIAYEYIIDPHTATALASSVQFSSKLPTVSIATASPKKFEDVINQVIPEFSNQYSLNEEEYLILENDIGLIEDAINQHF